MVSNGRKKSVRHHLCEAPDGPVPGKWCRTLVFPSTLTSQRPRRADARRRAGFNLLEVSISSLLVGILLITSMRTVGALIHRCGIRAQQDIKLTLAHDLLSEMQQAVFQEPSTTAPSIGIDTGESTANRQDFDDIDDYHGWTESTVRAKDGSAMAGYGGYQRRVSVEFVEVLRPNTPAVQATDLKRITIQVIGPDNTASTVTTLRGRYSPLDVQPGLYATYVRAVRVQLELEQSSSPLSSGSGILNQIAVEAPL